MLILIWVAILALCITWGLADRSVQKRRAAAAEAAARAEREERARKQREQQRNKAEEAELQKRYMAEQQRVRAEQQRARQAERQARQEEAHAQKVARARELAELAERKLAAERELAALRGSKETKTASTVSRQTNNAAESFASIGCMLANKYADNPDAIKGKAFTVTEKLDGVRCLASVDAASGRVSLYTRSGKRIEGLDDIESELLSYGKSVIFDGELMIENRDTLPSKEQYKAVCRIVRSGGRKTGVVYHIFDVITPAELEQRTGRFTYAKRRASLNKLNNLPHVEIVPVLYAGMDTAQIEIQLQAQRAANHEGVMINVNDAAYSFNRTSALLKYKVMNDCDLQIVAVNPGTGKNANRCGSLSVDYKGNVVRVGAGIPDALRREIWNNPTAYIGRVITVQYFEETQNAAGKKSLRFPAFRELRDIGKSVSYA